MDTKTIRLFLLLLCIAISQQITYQCDSDAICGCSLNSASINARIINGETAAADTWSWVTSLKIGNDLCGGAIISDSYILTAGHCVTSTSIDNITAYVGSIERFQGQPQNVSQIYLHPQYYADPSEKYILNDIALLKLSAPLNMTDKTLAKVCLPKSNTVLEDNILVTSVGWGRLNEGDTVVSETLQQVTLYTIPSSTEWCQYTAHNMTTQICAGLMPGGGKDTCQGDYGGPLMAFNNDSLWEVQGVASYGRGCAQPDNPGVHTRVAFYLVWINQIIENDPDLPTTTRNNMLSRTTSNKLIILIACFFAFTSFK